MTVSARAPAAILILAVACLAACSKDSETPLVDEPSAPAPEAPPAVAEAPEEVLLNELPAYDLDAAELTALRAEADSTLAEIARDRGPHRCRYRNEQLELPAHSVTLEKNHAYLITGATSADYHQQATLSFNSDLSSPIANFHGVGASGTMALLRDPAKPASALVNREKQTLCVQVPVETTLHIKFQFAPGLAASGLLSESAFQDELYICHGEDRDDPQGPINHHVFDGEDSTDQDDNDVHLAIYGFGAVRLPDAECSVRVTAVS